MPNDRRIKPAQNDILRTIVAGIDSFSTGQRRVASVIVADPLWAVHANVRDLAERASVSPPTIVRFARAVGCAGLKDFKIRLAGALALGTPYLHRSVRSDDSTTEVLRNIVGSVTSAVADWQRRIDPQALEKAAAAINAAGRVDCFGTGLTSNFLAEDMQARFFRLGLVSHTFSDAHLQLVAASTLSTRDVLIAISYVGRMPNLLEAVRVARARGATIVAITRSNTPLAALSDVLLSVDVQEDVTMRVGTEAYVVQLLLLEMLMVLIGLKRGGPTLSRLRRIHDVLHTHGSDGDDSEVHWAGC
jgi:DNA-binding MurR/RpiR family transcriptional regulator